MSAALATHAETGADRSVLTLLPLHVAAAMVTICGIGAVAATADLLANVQLWFLIIVAGHAVSLGLRWLRINPAFVLTPGLAFAALFSAMVVPSLNAALGFPRLQPDLELGTTLAWLEVARSFTLVNNASLLFCAVPALAMIGLMGSVNIGFDLLIFFGLLAFGTIFMAAYDQHLQRTAARGARPSPVSWHLFTAAAVFGICLAGGLLFTVVLHPLMSGLNPFALPLLAQNRFVQTFTAAAQSLVNTVPIGAGPIALSPQPLMEVYTRERGPLLLRTTVLEAYLGQGWMMPERSEGSPVVSGEPIEPPTYPSDAVSRRRIPYYLHRLPPDPDLPADPAARARLGIRTRRVDHDVVVLGTLSPMIPALGRPVEVRFPDSMLRVHSSGALTCYILLEAGSAFSVTSEVVDIPPHVLRMANGPYPPTVDLATLTALPPRYDRVRDLAEEITDGLMTNYDRVMAIVRYIEENYPYTLAEEPTPPGSDSVEYYLFESKRGACDLAASAAVMLCRSLGIPARAAIGYFVDESLPNQQGYLVRHRDAHMWLEVYFPGYGWVAFNPAPAPIAEAVGVALPGTGQLSQWWRRLLSARFDFYLVLVVAAGVAIAFYQAVLRPIVQNVLRRRRARTQAARAGIVCQIYGQMLRQLARAGWRRPPAMTPLEYRAWLAEQWHGNDGALAAVDRITQAFLASFYGPHPLSEAEASALRQTLAELRGLPRPPRRRETTPSRA